MKCLIKILLMIFLVETLWCRNEDSMSEITERHIMRRIRKRNKLLPRNMGKKKRKSKGLI